MLQYCHRVKKWGNANCLPDPMAGGPYKGSELKVRHSSCLVVGGSLAGPGTGRRKGYTILHKACVVMRGACGPLPRGLPLWLLSPRPLPLDLHSVPGEEGGTGWS